MGKPITETEVAEMYRLREQGWGWRSIGKALGRDPKVVRLHLDPKARERQRNRNNRWKIENPNRHRENAERWRRENPDRAAAKDALKEARNRGAQLPNGWTSAAIIRSTQPIYRIAREITELTGRKHCVCHIVPPSRGGLHARSNLRVRPVWALPTASTNGGSTGRSA